MLKLSKRKIICVVLSCIILFSFSPFGCGAVPESQIYVCGGASVHYLDVGQGDAVYIKLPDGKNLLIDCGAKDFAGKNEKYIEKFLSAYSVEALEYMILTHPDSDHIGNAAYLIEKFGAENAFVPYITEETLTLFPEYGKAYALLKEKQTVIKFSNSYTFINGENYAIAFLSPMPLGTTDSSYSELNSAIVPTGKQINNVSPIIYMEICGVRFLFTGDAEKEQESLVVSAFKAGIYRWNFSYCGINLNHENVDFLKVAHHGSNDSSSEEFLEYFKPVNAVISVAGINSYGHPSSSVLKRLENANPNYRLYRTDVAGTVSVRLEGDGKYSVFTENA